MTSDKRKEQNKVNQAKFREKKVDNITQATNALLAVTEELKDYVKGLKEK